MSCPRRLSSSTAGSGKFSFAYRRAIPLCRFIIPDLLFNFLAVAAVIGPRISQILSPQGRITPKQICFCCFQLSGSHQNPNWDTGANDARFPSANARQPFDAGKGFTQVARHPLEELRFFSPCHLREEFLSLLECTHCSSLFFLNKCKTNRRASQFLCIFSLTQ